MVEIRVYTTEEGWQPFSEWLLYLRDIAAQSRIRQRIERMRLGNFGDHKSVGGGVYELRIFFGPGYRVYYAKDGEDIVLLLCGGDKTGQARDIEDAKNNWDDYKKGRKQ